MQTNQQTNKQTTTTKFKEIKRFYVKKKQTRCVLKLEQKKRSKSRLLLYYQQQYYYYYYYKCDDLDYPTFSGSLSLAFPTLQFQFSYCCCLLVRLQFDSYIEIIGELRKRRSSHVIVAKSQWKINEEELFVSFQLIWRQQKQMIQVCKRVFLLLLLFLLLYLMLLRWHCLTEDRRRRSSSFKRALICFK